MNKSEFVTGLLKLLAKELTEQLPAEAEEIEYLKHTKAYVDRRVLHIIKEAS